jgi:predicted peptidase
MIPATAKWIATVASVLALAACGGEAGPSSERLTLKPIGTVAGAPLGYVEYLPPGYGEGKPPPLLVFLHGSSGNGGGTEAELEGVFDTAIPMLIRQDRWPGDRPFVVLMPQHSDAQGVFCPDPSEIQSFLAFAIQHYTVDSKRVYLTGNSCGGIGGWEYLAVRLDEVVAAAVLVAGDGRYAFAHAGCDLGRVPIWAFHGADDTTLGKSGSVDPIRALEQCTDPPPIDARLTVYPGAGHGISDQTYDLTAGHDIYAWLLSHEHA